MSGRMRIWTTLAVALATVATPAWATVITDFSNIGVTSGYGSWGAPSATLTPGPDNFLVQSTGGFGGSWYGLPAPVACLPSETQVALTVTTYAGNQAGAVIMLVDGDGTEWGYRWFGLAEGTQTLVAPTFPPMVLGPAGADEILNFQNIVGMHLQVDTGGQVPGDTYLSFDNLAITPEPAALALLGLGALAVIRRRAQ